MKKVRLLLSICVIGFLSITTVSGQVAYDSLFLVGDATPSGWNISSPVPMIRSEADTNVFTWEGLLTVGKLKLSTYTGNWCDGDWLNAAAPDQPIDSAAYVVRHGCDGDDNQWVVSGDAAGKYLLTVNFTAESILFEQMSTTIYDSLYIVGDATPSGWDIATPLAMIKNVSNPFLFTWQGILKAGQLKFSTFKGNWCDGDWLNASEADQPIADASYIITHGCDGPDNKWLVTSADSGEYVITINMADTLITIVPYVVPSYDSLYLVGDATPSGWNIATPEPMVKDAANAKVFTWEGTLTAGEVKFSTFRGNWCDGDWINASQADQVLTATDFIVTQGCDGPDNKWKLAATDAGDYKITINLVDSTIAFTPKTGVVNKEMAKFSVYPNPATDRITIDLGNETNGQISIYTITGKLVYQNNLTGNRSDIDTRLINASGMLLIKISTAENTEVSKLIIK